MDNKIETKIMKLFEVWHKLELESRRKDLSKRKNFDQKEKVFLEDTLNTPMNIAKKDSETILKNSGILNWKEDFLHLQNQLEKIRKVTWQELMWIR